MVCGIRSSSGSASRRATCLGVCLAAYEQWLRDGDATLLDLLDEAFRLIDERIDTDVVQAHRSPRG